MTAKNMLETLAEALLSGAVEVVDLTAPLGPDTPLIKLPPEIGKNTPKIEVHNISNYDKNGPFWSWNWLKLGEHSGTHFDAPIHWISGKDYTGGSTDTIPLEEFRGAGQCHRLQRRSEEESGFPPVRRWRARLGEEAWRHRQGHLGRDAHRLVRTQWQREGFPQCR